MNNKTSRIIKRSYYKIHFVLVSPLCISSGIDDETDFDLMLDGEGKPFIPGTSIAGAFRNALMDEKDNPSVLGYSRVKKSENNEESDESYGRMSQIIISDVPLVKIGFDNSASNQVTLSVRDGIKLEKDEKITSNEGKFDMQIVEPGAEGYMNFEVVERENDEKNDAIEKINALIIALDDGEIRFGSKKNRGFGKVKVLEVGEKIFDYTLSEQAEKWLEFLEDDKTENDRHDPCLPLSRFEDWKNNKNNKNNKNSLKETHLKIHYARILVPLELSDGISIRKYSTRPGEADYEQLTIKEDENGNKRVPVVPGSSWNGAIRRDAIRILRDDLKHKCADEIINDWFGTVDKSDKDKTQQSKIVISESKIMGATELPMTRVKINRFDSSAISGGLYSEISFFGGSTTLEILVRRDESDNYKAIMGLLYLVIKDIMNGFVAIGGQTAVGRGIFEGDELEEFGGLEIEECLSALKKYLEGRE